MDMENEALSHWNKPIPIGRARAFNREWVDLIKTQVDFSGQTSMDAEDHRHLISDNDARAICVYKYRQWVISGGGDEWFQPDGFNVTFHN